MEKLAEKDRKYAASIARVNRAALNMQHITETLLWLSSEDERQLEVGVVSMGSLIESLIEDNHYLLEDKVIQIQPNISTQELRIEIIPCQLIINNILRNAFQYTQKGIIKIDYSNQCLVIENNCESPNAQQLTSSDYGYGLGLQLVERIVSKMRWQYQHEPVEGGRKVTIHFPKNSTI